MKTENCLNCGNLFEKVVHNKKYCCEKCCSQHFEKREKIKKIGQRYCKECGEAIPFEKKSGSTFCNQKCKTKHQIKKGTGQIKDLAENLKHLIKNEEGEYIAKIKNKEVVLDKKYLDCVLSLNLHIDKGYIRTTYKYCPILIHRVIFYLEYGIISTTENPIDHIDRNRLNNTIKNLRLTTRGENSANTSPRGKTGYKGVYKNKDCFIAQISINKKNHHIGRFSSAEEAAIARETYIKSMGINR